VATLQHRVGEMYWYAWFDDETRKVELDQYGLRSIRKGTAYFTAKLDGTTWGKRSTKTGDFGWLDPVPAWARCAERVGGDSIRRYGRSRSAALKAAIAAERKNRSHYKGEAEIEQEIDIALSALTSRLRRAQTIDARQSK